MDDIIIFTDGSFIKNKKDTLCGYGVYFPNGEYKNISKKFIIKPLTNQRAELYAIYKAIKKVHINKKIYNIIIYSDSEYSIKSLTIWIKNWKNNNWKSSKGQDVLNQDIIKKIDKLIEKYKGTVKFIHVKAHTNNKDKLSLWNDEADKLAKAGASSDNI
jgi:ribonuclease HI